MNLGNAINRARFTREIAPYLGDAYSLARWITGSGPDAEDIVQDASLRTLRGAGNFADGKGRPWLLAIVRNAAYDWLRKNRSNSLVFVDEIEEVDGAVGDHADASTPEAAFLRQEEATLVESAMHTLPLHFRETLLLREVHGMSYLDIAKLTGISIGTTMSRLYRARRLMIAKLQTAAGIEAVRG
jgi:RNA polymerase sigma-70 factor (ECF subfamily)